ncbi:unnamed protein product [Hymenolepis diminuta]|uniref:Uncharacterized protein n=1 Tax=Hymenolepis diminuta TaxID=6216 RepID=A0A564Z1W4_HYMDI|nr:unnamed protein product [Hymenolepis diminuta]
MGSYLAIGGCTKISSYRKVLKFTRVNTFLLLSERWKRSEKLRKFEFLFYEFNIFM